MTIFLTWKNIRVRKIKGQISTMIQNSLNMHDNSGFILELISPIGDFTVFLLHTCSYRYYKRSLNHRV